MLLRRKVGSVGMEGKRELDRGIVELGHRGERHAERRGNAAEEPPEEHEQAENDAPEAEKGEAKDDGSNVVSVDFTRKK